MYINNIDLKQYGVEPTFDYEYQPPKLNTDYYKGRYKSNFTLLTASYDMGQLSVPLVLVGESLEDAERKKSQLDSLVFNNGQVIDIVMPDGFRYFAFATDIGKGKHNGPGILEFTYTFSCIRHGALESVEKSSFLCLSTLPYTDCRISFTVGADNTNYVVSAPIGQITFPQVTQGQQIVIDGILNRVLLNGAPAANIASWIRFPSLVPGKNTIVCPDPVTVEYYPSFF